MAGTLKKKQSTQRMEATTAENDKVLTAISENMVTEVKETEETTKTKKQNDSQLITCRMNKEQYENYKKFFMTQGLSFSKALKMSIDYLYSEIISGNLEIRESGIRQTVSSQLRNIKR